MKKIIVKHFLVALFLIISLQIYCQQKNLRIGDQCPDILIKHLVNYQADQVSMTSFRGKLLILDFWATWCAPCVSMIPLSDSLQKKFEGKIQILPVTDQDSQTVKQFLKNFSRFNHINMPSVTGDISLRSLFPHNEIPHYVWIDQNSIVVAITGAEQFTEANIQRLLSGNEAALPVKEDVVKRIDESKPMFKAGIELIDRDKTFFEKIEDTALLYHSVITKYIEGFGSETGSGKTKIESKNNSIGGLYRIAAGHYNLSKLNLNSTIWEISDPANKNLTDSAGSQMSKQRQTAAWMKDYTFCYELKFPPSLNEKKFDIMLSDLNNYFGAMYNIEGRLEKRKSKCLALVQTGKSDAFKAKGTDENNVFDGYHLKLTNRPMKALVNFLGINLDYLPQLVDETGYEGKIDIDLNCNLSDLGSVNQALAIYGLRLQQTEREMDMIVIKDKPKLK